MTLLNQTQYAAHRNVSKMAVSKWVSTGKIPTVGKLIDQNAADAALARNNRTNLHPSTAQPRQESRPESGKRGSDTGPVPGSLAHAQLVHETAKARKAALEAQRLEGTVVSTEDAVTEWGRMIGSARAAILLIPDKLAPKLAPVVDVRECRAILGKEMSLLLTGLSGYQPHE